MLLAYPFQIGIHRERSLLVYVDLKSAPNDQVERIAAEDERIPAVHDTSVGEVQVDLALAIDHVHARGADRARGPFQ